MATARNYLDKMVAGVSTRANFLSYFNSNMDIIDAAIAKCNFAAAADPTVNDDSVDGYVIGSRWWNTTGHKLFQAESVAVGAAVWRQIYPADVAAGIHAAAAKATPADNDEFGLVDSAASYILTKIKWSQIKTALGSVFAPVAKGVTNGDSHDHNGGDGAQIDHGGLGGLSDDDHTQYIKHALATAANDFLVASGSGAFIKKTLAQTQALIGTGVTDHGALTGLADDDHTQYIKHSLATAGSDFLVASGAGAFIKKTLAETKTILGVTASPASSCLTVGMSGSGADYECDGTDDDVTIQSALGAAYSAGKDILVLNGYYNFGSAGYIILPVGTALLGATVPRFGEGIYYDANLKSVVAFNIVSTSTTPIRLRSGSRLENIYFRYPNQTNYSSPTVYPVTIIGDVGATSYASGIVIKNCTSANAYKFLELTENPNDTEIVGLRGMALNTGITINNCGHVARMTDCQFVPAFSGIQETVAIHDFIADHFTGFNILSDISGYLESCKVWPGLLGASISANGFAILNCLFDACQQGITLSGNDNLILGGGVCSFRLHNDLEEWNVNLTGVTISGDRNRIIGLDCMASHSGVYLASTSDRCVISGCRITYGRKNTGDYCAGIWNSGKYNIVAENHIDGESKTATFGIFNDAAEDSMFCDNIFYNNASGDLGWNGTCKRIIIDGSSTNAGVPGSAGDWQTITKTGIIVWDTSGSKAYLYVNGAWRALT